jgi:hypothetical protein
MTFSGSLRPASASVGGLRIFSPAMLASSMNYDAGPTVARSSVQPDLRGRDHP